LRPEDLNLPVGIVSRTNVRTPIPKQGHSIRFHMLPCDERQGKFIFQQKIIAGCIPK
jgi:hypothetical protein